MLSYVFEFLMMVSLVSSDKLFRLLQPIRFNEESTNRVLHTDFLYGDSKCYVTVHQWRLKSVTRFPGVSFKSYFYLAELRREVSGKIVDVVHGYYPHPTSKFFVRTKLPHLIVALIVSRRFMSNYTGPYNPITQ